ncbi:MAG: hypothetical protein IT369_05725 [Candidatus Latescibacteria bacterium]|nr:hypothetical protein [Candidatus Latescibacterota bacterium]
MAYQGRSIDQYRLLHHDEGEPLLRQSWPPTAEGLKRATVEGLEGYPIDVFSYGIQAACGAYHLSAVLDRMGDGVATFKDTGTWKIAESLRRFEQQGLDPTALSIEACHGIGLDVNLRVRINDLHDIFYQENYSRPDLPPKPPREPGWYYMSKHKQEHPELLLGRPGPSPKNREEVEAYAYNYALAPVRERTRAFVAETATNYDLDALTLDFMRWPYLFKREEAYAQRHLMTDYIASLREVVRDAARRRGRPIHFLVRLPDTVEGALRMGIDGKAWLERGLLDLIIIGAGYNAADAPWDEWGDLAARHGVPVLATLRSSGEPPHYPGDPVELYYRKLRAATLRAYQRGAAGLELFNYFYHLPFYQGTVGGSGSGTGFEFTRDLMDRQRLAGLPRTYEVSRQMGLEFVYGHAYFPGHLPCSIGRAEDGLGPTLTLDLPEEVPGDTTVRLWLQLTDLWHEHELEITWNGTVLPFEVEEGWNRYGSRSLGHLELPVPAPLLRRGENRLGLRLLQRPANLDHFITLYHALLHLDFH